ncbi:hypothetical protein ACVRWQ_05955 [Streptococcus phocae subsp. salmonis]|uniref:hypothetical protein n=1 Tax=Streptococcus phocae TaxID=119224 RepID=UPI0005318E92|nr:hypothetical protein [Streptococcus phocae]KGR72883.1 hypothetical protein NX86_03915 [Streptococcus phocae subsp. salmonis]QBX27833.1 glutamate synthase [NADPH] large chain [Streptococcus phage Javan420]
MNNKELYQEIKEILKHNTPIVERSTSLVGDMKNNPNDMAEYLPKILQQVKESGLIMPKTLIIKLPPEFVVETVNGTWTNEKKKITNDLILKYLSEMGFKDDILFIKTGTFSSKFNFEQCQTNREHLTDNFIEILYNSVLCGAGTVNTLIVREYIEEEENSFYIYNGMPLREEIRYFVDFDNKKVLGYADYWNEKAMTELIHQDLSLNEAIVEANNTNGLPDYKKQRYADFKNWYRWHKTRKENSPQETYQNTITFIEKFVNQDNDLKGRWSIDIMPCNDQYYFIDAALMNQSALVDLMVKI